MSIKDDGRTTFVDQMSRLMKEEDNLISYLQNTAHQMRTPMTLIRSYTELLLAEFYGEIDPGIKEKLETISTNMEEITYFVDQIQDIGYISNRSVETDIGLHDLTDIVEKIVDQMAFLGMTRAVTFKTENLGEPHHVMIDQNISRRAISHLLRYVVLTAPMGNNVKVAIKTGKERTLLIVFGFGEVMDQGQMADTVRSMSEKEARLTTMEWERLSLPIAKALMDLQGGGLTVFGDEMDRTVYVLEFLKKEEK